MLTTNPELEAYLVPSRPWIDALATWLVPNKLSSTKFCQLIRSDRKEKVSFYFVGTSSKVSLTFKLRPYRGRFFTDWLISSSCNAFISVTIHREKTRPQSQSSYRGNLLAGKFTRVRHFDKRSICTKYSSLFWWSFSWQQSIESSNGCLFTWTKLCY